MVKNGSHKNYTIRFSKYVYRPTFFLQNVFDDQFVQISK